MRLHWCNRLLQATMPFLHFISFVTLWYPVSMSSKMAETYNYCGVTVPGKRLGSTSLGSDGLTICSVHFVVFIIEMLGFGLN